MLNRRQLLQGSGALALGAGAAWPDFARAAGVPLAEGLPDGVRGEAVLEALPGKKKLIKLSYRPPNYETPVAYFANPITPNDAFFVRYHLADIPEAVDAATWRLKVGGDGAASPLELSLDELRRLEPVELTAVCQCSGNRRGLSQPHVPGVQWGYGAMGNARWKGARLRDILGKAGIKKEAAVEIVFDGADGPVVDTTPDFVKSLPAWKAFDENTLVAYEMNGAPLPHLNGFPARLVVPGWTGTYWMKHLVSVTASSKPFDGFWMKSAYRIPKGKFPVIDRFLSQESEVNTPITEMVVNSLIISPANGQRVAVGQKLAVRGIAWDGGYGIEAVAVSADGGKTWSDAGLGADEGRFSFRPWSHVVTPAAAGRHMILARATNRAGATQTSELIFNPAGYHNNIISRVSVTAG
jgi:DMSO/TMAO reductase YedYZ molybdopterin-dependent catalytic subunit